MDPTIMTKEVPVIPKHKFKKFADHILTPKILSTHRRKSNDDIEERKKFLPSHLKSQEGESTIASRKSRGVCKKL